MTHSNLSQLECRIGLQLIENKWTCAEIQNVIDAASEKITDALVNLAIAGFIEAEESDNGSKFFVPEAASARLIRSITHMPSEMMPNVSLVANEVDVPGLMELLHDLSGAVSAQDLAEQLQVPLFYVEEALDNFVASQQVTKTEHATADGITTKYLLVRRIW